MDRASMALHVKVQTHPTLHGCRYLPSQASFKTLQGSQAKKKLLDNKSFKEFLLGIGSQEAEALRSFSVFVIEAYAKC
jgi:hypothetical protein